MGKRRSTDGDTRRTFAALTPLSVPDVAPTVPPGRDSGTIHQSPSMHCSFCVLSPWSTVSVVPCGTQYVPPLDVVSGQDFFPFLSTDGLSSVALAGTAAIRATVAAPRATRAFARREGRTVGSPRRMGVVLMRLSFKRCDLCRSLLAHPDSATAWFMPALLDRVPRAEHRRPVDLAVVDEDVRVDVELHRRAGVPGSMGDLPDRDV